MLNDADAFFQATDTLVYLASTSVPATYANEPWNELTANVQPAFELFDSALKANSDLRIVYVSSGGTVYGRGHTAPTSETTALEPISAYGYGELATEEAIRVLSRTKGLNRAILRVSNPVGRWQTNQTQGIIAAALRAAASGEGLNLFNNWSQVRDFLDAEDLANAIIQAADARNFNAETWNIGSGRGHSITEVVDLVSEVTGRRITCNNLPGRSVDVSYSVLNCEKVEHDLGWTTKIDLVDSIKSIERAWSNTNKGVSP